MTIRIFNFFIAFLLSVFLLIPFLLVVILVKLTSKGPAVHWSKRIGKNNKIFLNDYDIVNELSTYVVDGTSYNAEDGYHDDLIMCLVLFAWLIQQNYFKDTSNTDIRRRLLDEQEDNFTPFGFIHDGQPEENNKVLSDFEFDNYLLN